MLFENTIVGNPEKQASPHKARKYFRIIHAENRYPGKRSRVALFYLFRYLSRTDGV
jgi:hypothetical protein